jgi:hypothetical protein
MRSSSSLRIEQVPSGVDVGTIGMVVTMTLSGAGSGQNAHKKAALFAGRNVSEDIEAAG